ncbi:Protein of unknown function, DUF547 [Cellulophaga tyrosinoxydans]|uniref:DUF547 domain-containing protein n=2 Tax=Cellulophaga tyrosinoxydans TaxID=504486 RepID=A0A1W2CPK8_9FLAO|nr:Protein of unknown function, DUF547 [Cellulophaga tyrosinoxydans]
MNTMSTSKLTIISLLALLIYFNGNTQQAANEKTNFNALSEQFLRDIKNNKNTEEFQQILYNTSIDELEKSLITDAQKLAFWINVYNGYIQVILYKNPDLYKDRRDFFSEKQLPIAGEMVSFAKIEHGIIRKSQWPLGLGMVRKWFPNKFERRLRVDARDYRIHFALNCGAKDCPPVAIYEADRLNEQLNTGTKNYLTKTSTYNKTDNTAEVTALFNWFRGDFGCKKGVKQILADQGIIPSSKGITILYKNYDWTLDLDNWTNL